MLGARSRLEMMRARIFDSAKAGKGADNVEYQVAEKPGRDRKKLEGELGERSALAGYRARVITTGVALTISSVAADACPT